MTLLIFKLVFLGEKKFKYRPNPIASVWFSYQMVLIWLEWAEI
jgi:hypothetical protein